MTYKNVDNVSYLIRHNLIFLQALRNNSLFTYFCKISYYIYIHTRIQTYPNILVCHIPFCTKFDGCNQCNSYGIRVLIVNYQFLVRYHKSSIKVLVYTSTSICYFYPL